MRSSSFVSHFLADDAFAMLALESLRVVPVLRILEPRTAESNIDPPLVDFPCDESGSAMSLAALALTGIGLSLCIRGDRLESLRRCKVYWEPAKYSKSFVSY